MTMFLGTYLKKIYDANQIGKVLEQSNNVTISTDKSEEDPLLVFTKSLADETFKIAKIDSPVVMLDNREIHNMMALSKYKTLTANHYVIIAKPVIQDLFNQKISIQAFQAIISHETNHLRPFDVVITALKDLPIHLLKINIEAQAFLNLAAVLFGATTWSDMFLGYTSFLFAKLINKGVVMIGTIPLLLIARRIQQLREHACDIYAAEILSPTYMIEALRYLEPYAHSESDLDDSLAVQPALVQKMFKLYFMLFLDSHPEIDQRIKLLEDYIQLHPEVIPDGRKYVQVTEQQVEELPLIVTIQHNKLLEEEPEPLLEKPKGMLLQFKGNQSRRKEPVLDLPGKDENNLNTLNHKATRSGKRY